MNVSFAKPEWKPRKYKRLNQQEGLEKTALFVMHILSGMKKLSPLVRVVIHHKSSYNICVAFESKEEVQQDF